MPANINNEYINAAISNNTRKAYRCDVRHFKYCAGLLPATIENIISYTEPLSSGSIYKNYSL